MIQRQRGSFSALAAAPRTITIIITINSRSAVYVCFAVHMQKRAGASARKQEKCSQCLTGGNAGFPAAGLQRAMRINYFTISISLQCTRESACACDTSVGFCAPCCIQNVDATRRKHKVCACAGRLPSSRLCDVSARALSTN